MNSESQAIEFPGEARRASDQLDIRRLRRGFVAAVVPVPPHEGPWTIIEQFAAIGADEVAAIARDWALGGDPAAVPGVSLPSLVGAAKDVLIAYGQMSRPKGAGAHQLDAAIVGLGRVIGIESFRPEKGPDYGAGVASDEDSGLSEAGSDV